MNRDSKPGPSSSFPCSRRVLRFGTILLLAGGPALAQTVATVPHWSTYFGGTGHDLGAAVCLGPGGLVTVAGTTTSPGLATTPGAFQQLYGGAGDAFVARFDPSLPPGQQLVWCTYLGGSGMDVAFDAVVDGNGVTTVVGLTDSPGFPMSMPSQPTTGYQPTKNGNSDGFVAQIDPSGSVLLYATHVGGSRDDRLCGVAVDLAGRLVVTGVTESTDLQNTGGTVFPTYHGGLTDAFVARIDPTAPPAQQLLWATYVGATGQDGPTYAALAANGLGRIWIGNFKKQLVAFDRATGNIVATTEVNGSAPAGSTTAGCFQAFINGLADTYLTILDPTGSSPLVYGTYFGGTDRDFPYAMALHPAGGVVIGGSTRSTNMRTTTGAFQTINNQGPGGSQGTADAFVCWLDPNQGTGQTQLRYSSYFGGNGGEELFTAVAIESSGVVTLGGTGFGRGTAPFPTTPGCLLPSANTRCGAVVRLSMNNNGAQDLVYSSLLGQSWTVMHGVVLDEVGDAFVTGTTQDPSYPTLNAHQGFWGGQKDVAITHLPLLAGGTSRSDIALATPACSSRLYTATLGAPQVGNLAFGLSSTNAPPAGLGAVVFAFGTPTGWSQRLLNAKLLVPPFVVGNFVITDVLGFGRYPLPLPANVSRGTAVDSQWLFLTNAACPGTGIVAASERLTFTTF